MYICYIKETLYNKNNVQAYCLRVFASEYSYNRFFSSNYLKCKPGAMYGRKSNFILTFLLEGCFVYQIYQIQYLQSHKPGLWDYKIIK